MEQNFDWPAYVDAMAALHELTLDEARRVEVVNQLCRISALAERFLDFPLPPDIEPAPTFYP